MINGIDDNVVKPVFVSSVFFYIALGKQFLSLKRLIWRNHQIDIRDKNAFKNTLINGAKMNAEKATSSRTANRIPQFTTEMCIHFRLLCSACSQVLYDVELITRFSGNIRIYTNSNGQCYSAKKPNSNVNCNLSTVEIFG